MPLDVTIPQIGESITHVFIGSWLKKAGETVQAGEGLLELDSDKASMEVPSPITGTVVETLCEEGDEVPIGAVVARIEAGEGAAIEEAVAAKTGSPKGDDVRAGPAARREADAKGVDLKDVEGTGPRGRVVTGDLLAKSTPPPAGTPAPAPAPAPSAPADRIERVKMSPLRRTIARRLVQAQQEAAMLTTFNEVDMGPVMDTRKKYQDRFVKRHGHKLGFMSFFVKAVIEGLKAYPALNAEIDGTDILYKNFYNIGVAVSGPKGLVVPVIRDVDRLSFSGVETSIMEVAKRARDNKLSLNDFKDGTFTISNGGIFGSMMSTPILNPPQVGILGMHNIVQRPVAIDGQVVIRPMMYLALSYDHRIVDGREAVSFLVRVKECIEAPERILLEV